MHEHTFEPKSCPGVKVTVSYPLESQMRRYERLVIDGIGGPMLDHMGNQVKDSDGDQLFEVNIEATEAQRKAVITAHVVAIEGCVDRYGKPVSLDGVYDSAPSDLVIELVAEIKSAARLTAQQKKTSSASTDSQPIAKAQPSGTAKSAEQPATTSPAAAGQESAQPRAS